MKNLNLFFKFLKIWFLIVDIILICIFCVLCFCVSKDDFYFALIFSFVSACFFTALEIFLFKFYGNVVVSVSFADELVVIKTNTNQYSLPKKYFTLVKEEPSNGLTYIFYNDGFQKKKFVFIMRYAFKTHRLNISEMKAEMPYTKFE